MKKHITAENLFLAIPLFFIASIIIHPYYVKSQIPLVNIISAEVLPGKAQAKIVYETQKAAEVFINNKKTDFTENGRHEKIVAIAKPGRMNINVEARSKYGERSRSVVVEREKTEAEKQAEAKAEAEKIAKREADPILIKSPSVYGTTIDRKTFELRVDIPDAEKVTFNGISVDADLQNASIYRKEMTAKDHDEKILIQAVRKGKPIEKTFTYRYQPTPLVRMQDYDSGVVQFAKFKEGYKTIRGVITVDETFSKYSASTIANYLIRYLTMYHESKPHDSYTENTYVVSVERLSGSVLHEATKFAHRFDILGIDGR